MPSVDLSNTVDEIQGQIEALKTYTEVSKSYNALLKKTANSSSKSTPQLATQLDKFKDLQKRYLKDPPNSMDDLLGFLNQTKGAGSESLKYLRKQVLDVAVKMEPKVAAIVKEQTIKAIGCSQEQTYNGVSSSNLQIQPLPLRDAIEGIYIPISSVDFFSNLKNSPDTEIGKVYYEKPDPSADPSFKPYGGEVPFPMNKQLYQLTTTSNVGRSYSVINGKNYTGKSGQNLFDVQYTTTNNFGVTGDYYRVLLINREDGTGNITNNVGEFLSDYYSTIKLVDPVDVGAQLVNIVSGALNIQAQVGFGELEAQSQFSIIMQRILGLCFDNRREIDVSGVAKIAELDGVDDGFFELTEVDLRNIEVKIANVQNGVMEFEDCNNVKLPVDYEVLVDQLINFRNTQTGQTSEQQVSTIENIIDSISQNPDWSTSLPSNFNAELAINQNIIKQIPLAVAAGVLTPKILLPLFTLLSVVQSGATYTYNQAVTSANTVIQSANTASTVIGNAGATVGKAGSNIVTSGTDFIKKYKTFVIETVSKINGEFLRTLYEVLKKDILNLVSLVINDISKSARLKKYAIILKLVAIALFVSQLIDDYRRCKSLMSNVLYLLNLIGSSIKTSTGIPVPLLLAANLLPGYSPERATINAINGLQKIGIPTGTLPDGSPNLMLLYNLVTNKAVDKERAENEKINIAFDSAVTGVGKAL
jgi:hypothetical protein